mmetsp:Transcript_48023/g.134017  ORF Transcript_48023/g.134017 Transcript_48023/m.134017 type:complete len:208 (+) Transcript_48023:821-1444(+)
MPCSSDSSRPKNTASKFLPALSRSTADTSRSHWPSSTSQPSPTVIQPRSIGRSRTPPFSMANATFCFLGACGMKPRMTSERRGKMSMKCWPDCAGKSMIRNFHSGPSAPLWPDVSLYIAATTSTEAALCSISNNAISRLSCSSMTWSCPFVTSCKCPPQYAATTKTRRLTFCGNFLIFTQTISSMLSGLPAASSPEWVIARTAFKLL